MNGQLEAVEKQARQVRSKLRQKMVGNSIAASAGGSALHKLRLKKALAYAPYVLAAVAALLLAAKRKA